MGSLMHVPLLTAHPFTKLDLFISLGSLCATHWYMQAQIAFCKRWLALQPPQHPCSVLAGMKLTFR